MPRLMSSAFMADVRRFADKHRTRAALAQLRAHNYGLQALPGHPRPSVHQVRLPFQLSA